MRDAEGHFGFSAARCLGTSDRHRRARSKRIRVGGDANAIGVAPIPVRLRELGVRLERVVQVRRVLRHAALMQVRGAAFDTRRRATYGSSMWRSSGEPKGR